MSNTQSILFTNCKIVSSTGVREGNIFIEKGIITAILDLAAHPRAAQTINLSGFHVLPGVIDTHVHFRSPGAEFKEDWETGSKAAAAGGITTIIDMPNTTPPTTTQELVNQKRKITGDASLVNFGFFIGIDENNIEALGHATNCAGVKIYLDETTGNYKIKNENTLKKIFNYRQRFALHAEHKTFADIMQLIAPSGNPVHLCHANTAAHLETARHYKQQSYPLTVEVCPHHLFLSTEDLSRLRGFGMMKPPLASAEDQAALWDGIVDGTVDTIATDHAPHTKEEKESPHPPYGVPGLETSLPLMLNAVNQGRMTLGKMTQLMCENPAKIFGIKNKGTIKEGYDADLTVIDLDLEKEVKNENLFTKCGWSPFAGWKLRGWPVMTFVHGNLIFDHGQIVNDHNRGKEVVFEDSR